MRHPPRVSVWDPEHRCELLEFLAEPLDLELVPKGLRRVPRAPSRPALFVGADGLPTNLRALDSLRVRRF